MRRHGSGRGCGACGQGDNAPLAPGRRRDPPGDTKTPREELADVAKQPKSARRQKRGPDAEKTLRWSAGGRSVLRQRTHAPQGAMFDVAPRKSGLPDLRI
jgi:hypothetical protein